MAALAHAAFIYWLSDRDWSGGAPKISTSFGNLIHLPLFGMLATFIALAAGAAAARRGSLATAMVLTGLWGLLDEYHQALVTGRRCSMFDLVVDLHGAALACLLISIALNWRQALGWRLTAAVLVLSTGVFCSFWGAKLFPSSDTLLARLFGRP